jgi:maltooligosyltrehalose trehalohydrolase
MAQFPTMTHPVVLEAAPPPVAPETFAASKLALDPGPAGGPIRFLFRDLLALRRDDPVFASQRADRIHGSVLGADALALRYFGESGDDRLVLLNLGRDLRTGNVAEPLLAPPAGRAWALRWTSESPRYGGRGIPPVSAGDDWRIVGHGAIVLAPVAPAGPLAPLGEEAAGPLPIESDPDVHPSVRRRRFGELSIVAGEADGRGPQRSEPDR